MKSSNLVVGNMYLAKSYDGDTVKFEYLKLISNTGKSVKFLHLDKDMNPTFETNWIRIKLDKNGDVILNIDGYAKVIRCIK